MRCVMLRSRRIQTLISADGKRQEGSTSGLTDHTFAQLTSLLEGNVNIRTHLFGSTIALPQQQSLTQVKQSHTVFAFFRD
jgi:hypothetical protein